MCALLLQILAVKCGISKVSALDGNEAKILASLQSHYCKSSADVDYFQKGGGLTFLQESTCDNKP